MMLRSMKGMIGYTVLTPEGAIGRVKDFHFDRKNWELRYLVVKLGNIKKARKVFLSPANLIDKPDWGSRTFALKIPMATAEKAAGSKVESPKSREDEEKIHTFFGLDLYWAVEENVKDGSHKTGKETGPNLSSLSGILKYKAEASGEKAGSIMDVVIDDKNWSIRYLAVSTGAFFKRKNVLVSSQWIKTIKLNKAILDLDITKEQLMNCHKYAPHADIDRETEEKVHDYLQKPGYWAV